MDGQPDLNLGIESIEKLRLLGQMRNTMLQDISANVPGLINLLRTYKINNFLANAANLQRRLEDFGVVIPESARVEVEKETI